MLPHAWIMVFLYFRVDSRLFIIPKWASHEGSWLLLVHFQKENVFLDLYPWFIDAKPHPPQSKNVLVDCNRCDKHVIVGCHKNVVLLLQFKAYGKY